MKKVLIAALIAGFSLSATAAETIRFATEASYPPFESIDANNQIVGFDVDLAQALCKEIDATCTFSNQAFDSLIPSLKFRRVEAVMAGMDITPEREKQVLFTTPYYDNSALFVGQQGKYTSVDQLKGKKVGVQNGTTHQKFIMDKHPEITTVPYDSYQNAKLDLQNGRIDGVFGDTAVVTEWLKDNPKLAAVGDKVTDKDYFGTGLGIAVRQGNTELQQKLNTALEKVKKDGTYETIYNKWFQKSFLMNEFFPLASAAGMTVGLAVCALIVGLALAMFFAVWESAKWRPVAWAGSALVTILRGLPEILVVLFIYFGSSQLLLTLSDGFTINLGFVQIPVQMDIENFDVSPFLCGVIALSLLYAAYASQTLRGALKAVPVGQWESGQALGLSKSAIFFRLVMPQMWRHALPGLGNQWLVLLKDTALVSLISVNDLMLQTKSIATRTQEPFTWYIVAAAIYLVITLLSQYILKRIDLRATRFERRPS